MKIREQPVQFRKVLQVLHNKNCSINTSPAWACATMTIRQKRAERERERNPKEQLHTCDPFLKRFLPDP